MNIESVLISDLSNDPANARKHDSRNIETIVASLRRFGQQKPIVVDLSGIVRAGNGTLAAARILGWDSIDVIRTELKGSEATAYAIADNRTAELAEWDDDILAATLQGLVTDDEDLLAAAGFDEDELAELLEGITDGIDDEIEEDEVPEPPVDPITKPGDLWILGTHRVLCGDSTEAEDVSRLMDGEKAELCFTSPPYSDQRTYTGESDLSPSALSGFISAACDSSVFFVVNLGISRKNGFVVPYWEVYTDAAKQCGMGMLSLNVWYRPGHFSVGQITAMFPIEHEMIFVYGKSPAKMNAIVENKSAGTPGMTSRRNADGSLDKLSGSNPIRSHRELGTVIVCDPVSNSGDHPAMFPVNLASEYIKAFGFNVYDPFLGSGTTLIAAEQLGRKCYGMEISPAYCDVIVKRWENLTGEKATLSADP